MSKYFQVGLIVTTLSAGFVFASIEAENDGSVAFGTSYTAKKRGAEKKKCDTSPECPPPCEVCDPCACLVFLPSSPCPDRWRVSGDFLYLLPTVDDTYFALNSDTSTVFPNGKRVNNDFDFNSGFRVGAEWAFCDTRRELQAFYSHLNTRQHKTVSGSNLWATIGRPDVSSSFGNYSGSAISILNLMYQSIHANLSQQLVDSCGVYFYVQPGVEYAYLRLDENYSYNITGGALSVVDQKSRMWGVGPQLGLGLDYNFYQGTFSCSWNHAFSITSLFSGSILMGHGKTKNFQTLTGVQQLSIEDEHTWKTIPALHARAGLNYLVRGSRFGLAVEVGYEFNTYVRALSRVLFPDDTADGLCYTNYYNFDIQGLYVSGALSF
jgi:hypothetical protein